MYARRRRERGNIGIWAALAFTTSAGFMALAIHAGRSYSNRVELQNGADAAALAAAAHLDGTKAGLDAAAQAATAFGARHSTESQAISVAPGDVTFGSWDRASGTFTEIAGRTEADLRNVIAVRVRDARLDLPVGFGPAFLGASATTSVAAGAIAAGGGPCEDKCAFPAAFADCMLLDASGALRCDDHLYVLNSDWQDNLGLTSLDPEESASVPNIKAALDECVATSADTRVPVNNGNPINPIFDNKFVNSLPIEVVAPVVHAETCEAARYETCASSGPNAPCTNAKFVGDMPIVGYVSLVVCYVTGPNVKTWPPGDWGHGTPEQIGLWNECGPPPTQADFPGVPATHWPDFLKQTVFLKHRCHWLDPGTAGKKAGCQSFGIWTTRPRLVE
jgi:hypothetical protein